MLIDTADPRYGGAPDPDAERERRWEPIGLRLFLPVAGSSSCLILAAVATPALAYALDALALAVVLCLVFVRAAWPRRQVDTPAGTLPDASDAPTANRPGRAGTAGHRAAPRVTAVDTIRATLLAHVERDASLASYRDTVGFEVRNDVGYDEMRWITVGRADQPARRSPGFPFVLSSTRHTGST
jgi:hypothetical protein